jgi:hypothetical protein
LVSDAKIAETFVLEIDFGQIAPFLCFGVGGNRIGVEFSVGYMKRRDHAAKFTD